MSLQGVYQGFLADPKSAPLAPDVSFIYITTTTRFDQAEAVINHLSKQQKIVKKKSEEIISAIESPDSLCLDIETTLEFVEGGGAYLPSLDDNFLADRVATFPTLHIVRFNSQKQIQQVKLYWDQASLLKQIEVIGSRGRNWPIRDAKDLTRLIKSANLSAPTDSNPAPAPSPPANKEENNEEAAQRPSSGKRHIKDPYAAESLFDLLSPGKDRTESVRAPRAPASAQPPPRDLTELFGDDGNDTPVSSPSRKPIAPKAGAGKNYLPSRIFDDDENTPDATPSGKVIAPKAGAGKNFRPSRIFDDDEAVAAEQVQTPNYKAHPKRFSHFQIGGDNSEREIKAVPTRPKSQHMAQWNFEDFVTPDKPVRKPRGQEIRHFGWSDDEADLQDTPPANPRVPQPRRDAESHFELTDEQDGQAAPRMIKSYMNKGLSLYQNPLYNEEDDIAQDEADSKAPLSVLANGAHRKKDFDSHWVMNDFSPIDNNANIENRKPTGADRLKAVKMMEPSWDTYDESPQPSKAAPPPRRARHVNDRSWDIGDL